MMKRTFTIGSLAFLVFFIAGLWAGCMVDYDDQLDNTYSCTTDEDCIQPAFVCETKTNLCKRYEGPQQELCVDKDGDGYGEAGTDRSACKFTEPDCDDDDATVYPGAPEICDGKLNNCNATEIDVAPCQRQGDCPQQQKDPEGHPITYSCEANVCVAKSPKQICPPSAGGPCPECLEAIACVEGVLGIVPPACR